jgi:hypothetical protein
MLWQGRFHSCLVDSREYVLACHIYIELNPVRAGMADWPVAYRWSSHLGNTGHAVRDATTAGIPLASDSFKQQLALSGSRTERAKPGRKPRAVEGDQPSDQLDF